jgi:tetratricopeptide (TPR) repeat protein
VQVQPALVRVTDATTRWAAPYAAEPTDVFRVQADVAERVARALDVALDERQRVEIAAAPTQNPEAYDQFLRGTALEQRALLNPAFNGLQDAAAAYTRAVALDPAFGIAWARLAGSRLAYWDRRGTTRFASPALARVALDSARRLARDAPETRIAGSLYTILVEGDVDHAVGELRVAYRARPSNTDVLLQLGATLFERPGSLNEGLAYLARAAELDPRTAPVNVSHHFRMAGRYAEAIRYADRAIALIPDQFAGYDAKGQALIDGGFGVAAARPVLDSAVARLGATPVTRYLVQAWYNDATGFLGEPYESRLGALTLADYPAPPSAADSSNYYTAKALMWRRRGVSDRAASYCDSVLAHISPAARDVDSVHVPSGNRAIFDVGALAQMQACAGHRAEAMRYAAALRAAQRRSPSTFVASVIAFNLAHTYLFFDDRAAAVAQLERALRPPHYVSAHWVRVDPLYRSLRGYPPFEALLARAPK